MGAHTKLDEAKSDLNQASAHIVKATNEVKEQAQEYSDEIVDYIKESPVKSVLIASAIGLLVGKFLL